MGDPKLTIGQAIDQIAKALEPFDSHQRETIVSAVSALLRIAPATAAARAEAKSAEGSPPQREPDYSVPKSIRTGGIELDSDIVALKQEMQPSSAREMACLIAYYLSARAPKSERKDTITNADLRKYFKVAGYRLPERLSQLLPDSKKAGYFEASSRGEYRLTSVGYNLVMQNLPKGAKNGSARPSFLA